MLTKERVKAKLDQALLQAAIRIGELSARVDMTHTCDSDSRYPWPPDQDCQACRSRIERYVESNHLDFVYRVFGWNWVVEHYQRELNWRSERARIVRSLGSGI